jgi:molecular chaperone DnaJ
MTDYYEVLGVPPTATISEIKKKYRELAIKYHPDKTGGNKEYEDKFKEISNAYRIVGDVSERTIYDNSRMGEGFDFSSMFSGFNKPMKRKGKSVKSRILLTLREAILGTTKTFKYSFSDMCHKCGGKGVIVNNSCSKCNGAGRVELVRSFNGMRVASFETCRACAGTGGSGPKCSCANGTVTINRTQKVEVPPGIKEGNSIVLRGMGAASPDGGEQGDLIVYFFILMPQKHDLTSEQIEALNILC